MLVTSGTVLAIYAALHTWKEGSGFRRDKANVLRAFFHLTGQIERRGKDCVRICPSDIHITIESLNVHLRRRNRLLPDLQSLTDAG